MAREQRGTKVVIRFGAGCSLDAGSAHVRVFQADRRCRQEGCTTVLSIYNPSSYCSLHDRRQPDKRERQSDRQPQQRACAHPSCHASFATTNPARMYCSDRCRMNAFQQRRQAAKRHGRPDHLGA